jgi:hypothetical protein
MSLGHELLFVDFLRIAEVKPSSCPACTSASKSRVRPKSTPSPSRHKPSSARWTEFVIKDDWRARLQPAT